MNKKGLGAKGENLATSLLRREGYKILDKNFRSHFGEIDVVAQDKDTLVFVEVKTRWSREYGPPEEAVRPQKLRSIAKVGQVYQLLHPDTPQAQRIDVVAIELDESGKVTRKEIIKDATG